MKRLYIIFSSLMALFALIFSSMATSSAGEGKYGAIPSMIEEAMSAGITHQYAGPWEFFVGGGAASFDCNGDRMPDLFIAGGAGQAQLYVNRSKPAKKLKFAATKIDVPAKLMTNVIGAYPINVDNDDFTDLVVLRLGKNLILKGGADCTFSVGNPNYSFDGSNAWSTAFAAIWENGNKFPTLAFGNYVDRAAEGTPFGTCHDNRLLRPTMGTNGLPNYSSKGALTPGFCTLSMMFTDWDNSGNPALRITNDRQYYRGGREQLWKIPSSLPAKEYTAEEGWKELKIWGMGIAASDLNGDGKPEYVLSSMGDTKLQSLQNTAAEIAPDFHDIAGEKQATAHRPYTGGDVRPSTGWHVQFEDINNDGRQDLFVAKGNVAAMDKFAIFDPDNLLLGGRDGKFHEVGHKAGIALKTRGRGAIIEDFNADGMLDILVVNREANVNLFRNRGGVTKSTKQMGGWLSIDLDNGDFNRTAIGAKITVVTQGHSQTKTIQLGGGHASGQSGFTHFGLGNAKSAKIKVSWPGGLDHQEFQVDANKFVVIKRSSPKPLYWQP